MEKMHGVITAMVTPFTADDQVDVATLRAYTEYLIEKGVHCLYPCGTTGEMLKMSTEERKLVAETVIEQTAGRIPVFVHVGAMTTFQTIELAQHAASIRAAGIGVVTPQFFSTTDREMEEYFVAVATSVQSTSGVPLLYPPVCGQRHPAALVDRIVARTTNVVGVKYSYPDFIRVKKYLLCNGGDFDVVVGTDRLFLPALAMGCVGTVSGCSNCGPEPFVEVYSKYLAGDILSARKAQEQANVVCEITKNGANMAMFKAAMAHHGLPLGHMRAPALDLMPEECADLYRKLDEYHSLYN
jgi:4-hydroxy-tetrahydrodipicolinate synthase